MIFVAKSPSGQRGNKRTKDLWPLCNSAAPQKKQACRCWQRAAPATAEKVGRSRSTARRKEIPDIAWIKNMAERKAPVRSKETKFESVQTAPTIPQ